MERQSAGAALPLSESVVKVNSLPGSPACERNREPILQALRQRLPDRGRLLEIGSGTGEHAVYMAPQLTRWQWQPSDVEPRLAGLEQRFQLQGGSNILPALALDVGRHQWPDGPFDAVFTANTAHIVSWPLVCLMVAGAARVLVPGGVFALYGPFQYDGQHNSAGNAAFDQQLRQRDSAMGIRDALQVIACASISSLSLVEDVAMPANNRFLFFRRN